MENNNNKINIKALLEQNNIKVNNNEAETDFNKSISNDLIDEQALETVENANENAGVSIDHNDYLEHAGIRGC